MWNNGYYYAIDGKDGMHAHPSWRIWIGRAVVHGGPIVAAMGEHGPIGKSMRAHSLWMRNRRRGQSEVSILDGVVGMFLF